MKKSQKTAIIMVMLGIIGMEVEMSLNPNTK